MVHCENSDRKSRTDERGRALTGGGDDDDADLHTDRQAVSRPPRVSFLYLVVAPYLLFLAPPFSFLWRPSLFRRPPSSFLAAFVVTHIKVIMVL